LVSELLKELFLFWRQGFGQCNDDLNVKITPACLIEPMYAMTLDPQLGVTLSSWGHFETELFVIKSGDF
jgi:hypothetical protein